MGRTAIECDLTAQDSLCGFVICEIVFAC